MSNKTGRARHEHDNRYMLTQVADRLRVLAGSPGGEDEQLHRSLGGYPGVITAEMVAEVAIRLVWEDEPDPKRFFDAMKACAEEGSTIHHQRLSTHLAQIQRQEQAAREPCLLYTSPSPRD